MRAVWLREFGGPEVLAVGDAPDPEPRDGQVVVRVDFANITFIETQLRAGGTGPFSADLPMIPGNGVGGVVSAVGAGVDRDWLGARVVTGTGGSGGYAELALVDAAGLFRVPDELPMDEAVAVLADGRTATMLVDAVGVRRDDRVLVEAAAGGVGTLLVQLAASAGGRVIGAAGGPDKLAVVAGLGAEVTVDYRDAGWPSRVRDAVGGLDVVFDGVGGAIGRSAFELLSAGGRMVSFGLASGEWAGIEAEAAAERGVSVVSARADPARLRGFTADALAEAAAGRLRPVIGQRFPLAETAAAHAAIGSRSTIGKTLLSVR